MGFLKKLFGIKEKPKTATINIFGNDIIIDLSDEAQQKRKEEYEVMVQNSWQEIKKVDFIRDDGKICYATQWINPHEEELVGFYGIMRFSKNKNYCVVFVDAGNDKEKGKVALVDVMNKKLLYNIEINRPHKCNVSNNGIVVCNDWVSRTAKTANFIAINPNGEILFKKRVSGGLGDSAIISEDGKFAGYDLMSTLLFKVVEIETQKKLKSISLDYSILDFICFENNQIIINHNDKSKKIVDFIL